MEKHLTPTTTGTSACNILSKCEGERRTIVIKLSLGQLLRSGQDTIEVHLDNLPGVAVNPAPQAAVTGFFAFMETVIEQLKDEKRERTAEAYRAALSSLRKYRHGEEFAIAELTAQMMEGYEAWLRNNGVKLNSCSFYMRILRAVYNRAVGSGIVADGRPFVKVYTGNAKTAKRAVDINTIRQLESMPLDSRQARYARDMFLFSFYTRGMSFVDMAYLRKDDLQDGMLVYCRRKTGQRLAIRWELQMQQIIERNPPLNNKYLLPIIKKCNGRERGQYRHQQRRINEELHAISKTLGQQQPLTMYVARHSWASIAHSLDTPVGIISQGMGHDSERTTQIYLKDLDGNRIDDINKNIINRIVL